MKNIVKEIEVNGQRYRVIRKLYFETEYFEVQKLFMFLWFIPIWNTLDDGDFECPFTYKWKSFNDVDMFFKTGKIKYPGTVI